MEIVVFYCYNLQEHFFVKTEVTSSLVIFANISMMAPSANTSDLNVLLALDELGLCPWWLYKSSNQRLR